MNQQRSRSLWSDAWRRLKKDRLAITCFYVVVFYITISALALFGVIGSPWDQTVGGYYQSPDLSSWATWLGTDFLGRSTFYKVVHGARIALTVGLFSSLISVPIGLFFGALGGYFGGVVDEVVVWFYTTLSSIPSIMLLIGIAFVTKKWFESQGIIDNGVAAMCIALGLTAWVSVARVIRGEFIKHREREYVQAARAIGASDASRIFKHILPNVSHFLIISFSIHFMGAIKSEVILSFLGLGAKGIPSWGVMINDAKDVLTTRGVWWELTAATVAMLILVLALNIFGDALRDALDPKIK